VTDVATRASDHLPLRVEFAQTPDQTEQHLS
jgi:hypothetical protein